MIGDDTKLGLVIWALAILDRLTGLLLGWWWWGGNLTTWLKAEG